MVFATQASVDHSRDQRLNSPVNRREVFEYMEDSAGCRIVLFSRVAPPIGATTVNKHAIGGATTYW